MFEIEKIDDELVRKMETDIIADLIKISTKDVKSKFCMMPRKFVENYLERIKSMEIFEDDIWIVTFPKCGTTWTQEMVWMLNNNLDYETANKVKLHVRFPFLEWGGIIKNFSNNTFEECKNLERPRYIKTHLPLFLLPEKLWTIKPKIIYVARNPKDTAVSYYHHHYHLHCYYGSKIDFLKAFVKNLLLYSPLNEHVLEFWKIREQSNILFLFFEDMKRSLDQEVRKTMKFLDKNYSQKEIDKLCKHLSFESIKNNEMVNKNEEIQMLKESAGEVYDPKIFSFVRKGEVGGHIKELTAKENKILNDYIKCPALEESGFEYKF